jgi:hypothetical protein
MNTSARALTRSGLSAAAGIVVLYLCCILPWGRLALLCISTIGVIFVRMSCSCGWAVGCYAATALLGLLLLPEKAPALIYALFLGYYPLIRLRLERVGSAAVRIILKLTAFNIAALLAWALFRAIFAAAISGVKMPVLMLLIAANGVFLIYDYALGQMMLYYVRNLAGRFR